MEPRLKIPHWTPCKYDPDSFDCSDCEIGWSSCRLKTDESLRAFRASRARRFAAISILASAEAYELEGLVVNFLKGHGLSITSALLHQYIGPELPARTSEADIQGVLEASVHIRETSPGMFKLAEIPREKWEDISPLPVSSGCATENLVHEAIPFNQKEQTVRFKRLAGLRLLLSERDYLGLGTWLDSTIEELSSWASLELGWSHTDIYRFAVGSDVVPRVKSTPDSGASTAYADKVHKLLSAVSADEWRNRVSVDDLRLIFTHLRESLVFANLRLVSSRAMKWAQGGSLTYSDLFQEGSVGVMAAIDRFDPFRGNQFSTYATYWIDQRITRCRADFERSIRIPVHLQDRVKKVLMVEARCSRKLGRRPTVAEIAEELDSTTDEIAALLRHGEEVLSLDLLLEDSRSIRQNAFALIYDATDILDDGVLAESTRRDIDSALASLNGRESQVLRLRFGLDDQRSRTLQEIGEMFGVTRERIRQIEKKAIRKFKARYLGANQSHEAKQKKVDWSPYFKNWVVPLF